MKSPPQTSLNAIGYIRVSTDEQAESGKGLEVQQRRIVAYAEANNLELTEIIRDEGWSGKNLKRPGITRLLQMIPENQFNHLIVMKIDRLSRRTLDTLRLIDEDFGNQNIEFHSVEEKIDTSTASGRIFLTIISAFAQMERDLVSERTIAAMKIKIENGERIGRAPLGYKEGAGKLKVDEREQLIVKRIIQLRKSGMTLQHMADRLTEDGYKTKRGGQWAPGTVYKILNRNI